MPESQTTDTAGIAEPSGRHTRITSRHEASVKRPIGVYTLSSIEMWERFSF